MKHFRITIAETGVYICKCEITDISFAEQYARKFFPEKCKNKKLKIEEL